MDFSDFSDFSVGMRVLIQWYLIGKLEERKVIQLHDYDPRIHPTATLRFTHGIIDEIVGEQYFVKYGNGKHPEKRWESGKTREAWPPTALTKKKEPSPIDGTAVLNAAAVAERRAERRAEQALVLRHRWMWTRPPSNSCSSDEELSEDT